MQTNRPPGPSSGRLVVASSSGGTTCGRIRPGKSNPVNHTTPSAMLAMGSPPVASMSRPRWARAPSSRSSPGPLGSHAGNALQRRHHVEARVGLARADLLVQVAIDQTPSRDEGPIFAARAAHDIAPAEMRDRAAMGNRAGKNLVDSRVLILPHGQHGRAQAQIDERALQAQKRAGRNRPRLFLPAFQCFAVAHLVAQGISAHIALDHARLDLQEAGSEGCHQRRNAPALAIDQSRQ